MRIRINGLLSEKEMSILVAAGVDEIGICVGQLHPSRLFTLPSTAARLVHLMPPGIYPVLYTHVSNCDEIMELVNRSGIYTVQLNCWFPEEVIKLRNKLPNHGKIILTCYLDSPTLSLPELDQIYPSLDALSLDCCNSGPGNVSATLPYPSWEMAEKIIGNIPIPCYLSGGIGKENAPVGIERLKPYGIEADGEILRESGELNAVACREFVDNARTAAINMKI